MSGIPLRKPGESARRYGLRLQLPEPVFDLLTATHTPSKREREALLFEILSARIPEVEAILRRWFGKGTP